MAGADLLRLRLEALEKDIEKVSGAVERAKERSQFLTTARDHIGPCEGRISYVAELVTALVKSLNKQPQIGRQLNSTRHRLVEDLQDAEGLMADLQDAVTETWQQVDNACKRTVNLDKQSSTLQDSLRNRCTKVCEGIAVLKTDVRGSNAEELPGLWARYKKLLDTEARPVFTEYVDFLSGLAVRDAGLDDRVCGMTDGLLTRFEGATGHPLPLPARQAALGSALDSVVLLGFPEWSIWGIPLVGHEVGLAWAKSDHDDDFAALINEYARMALVPAADEEPDGRPHGDDAQEKAKEKAKDYVRQLLADVFATFTLGFSYACAALLLRLSPRADGQSKPGTPRDIDRGRVIIATLGDDGDTTPDPGGDFTDKLDNLQTKWEDAVREFASPAQPGAPGSWLDDFAKQAIAYLRSRHSTIPPYDQERWQRSDEWVTTLRSKVEGTPVRPILGPPGDDAPDMLTAAWRLRLDGIDPGHLAASVIELWDSRRGA